MTELQKTELEILSEFIKICDMLDLPYFAVCGTALGAARHGGFIPWDDDVDVAMPREAYQRFISEAPKLLPKHLFLQNYLSEPKFPMLYSKLRNSQTTYIEKSAAHLPINHGVYIDIFPLDGYPKDKEEQKRLESKKRLYSLQAYSAFKFKRSFKAGVVNILFKLLGYHKRSHKVIEKYTNLISAHDIDTSDLICNHGNWQGVLEYAQKEQYGNGTYAEFEGMSIRIPVDYDAYLTQKYGDWRKEPPKEKQVGHHYYELCDLHNPYTKYVAGK